MGQCSVCLHHIADTMLILCFIKKQTPKHSGFDEKALLKSYWLIFDLNRFSLKAITMRIRVMTSKCVRF